MAENGKLPRTSTLALVVESANPEEPDDSELVVGLLVLDCVAPEQAAQVNATKMKRHRSPKFLVIKA